MSLKAQAICPVPQETARVARAAYPKGNIYMQMRTVLGSIYTDEQSACSSCYGVSHPPQKPPTRLYLSACVSSA